MKGKSTLFWVVMVLAGSCFACSLLTAAVMLLGLSGSDVESSSPERSAQGALPTGDTPNLYPGVPGWLPSGRGVRIPQAEVDDGRPLGLWWTFTTKSDGKTFGARVMVLLADGTCATHPRPGGGMLFDVEGQRAQRGSTGVGTCELTGDGKFTIRADGYSSTDDFEHGSDDEGPFFKVGAMRYQPLAPPEDGLVVGTWKSPGSKLVFHEDGTFELGNIQFTDEYVATAGHSGQWRLDGYLVQLQPKDAPGWINTIAMSGDSSLIVGTTVYKRQ